MISIVVDRRCTRIPKEDLENNVNIIDEYVDLLNGIAYACNRYDEYSEGNRNTVAVDLTVACYMLGLDALKILDMFVKAELIDPAWDDEDPEGRVYRVLEYRYKFDWDWMIDPEQYLNTPKTYEDTDGLIKYADGFDEIVKLFFELV